ncbi:NAD(P)/FAD-dependent oxidoreductase [Palleronia caenipelagi]|uniref:NAD(P)/FAD-dependent oxidoreductase n=1 Tax=Palleronia caenipelagi TaxID=2489174 RepID=A0A547Q777_9RHOB|nr:FAD-dependent oxidoreductase [Palleronia caenipelagi]TRD22238.1 NAD(P)/FAD-dependent oxidoreductase [Palleronia caenipelagi]
MYHVILGAGPAGVTAAETIRKHAPDAEITLIGGEGEPPYSRMAIPYLLEGKIGEDGTHLRQEDGHYETLGIAYRHGPVISVDTGARSVTCADGSTLGFDTLLIATGATPIRPPIEGLDSPGVHTCWTLEDARRITEHAQKGEPVVLVGAGFIGCIILESLAKMGVDLTVVERGDRMVPRMLDETAGNMLRHWCEGQDVRVITEAEVDAIRSGDRAALAVHLKDGQTLPAALVVIATGVRSNIGFLDGSGIETGAGVKVDPYHETNVPGIYAAGDVAEGINLSTGHNDMLAIQPVAVEHAYIAALNMCGIATEHRGSLNMNVLDTLGLISSSFGTWEGVEGGDRAVLTDEAAGRYIRLEFEGDRLIGAQTVGLTDHVGMLRGLIQTGLPLGAWKNKLIDSPTRIAEAYVAVMQQGPVSGYTGPKVALPA